MISFDEAISLLTSAAAPLARETVPLAQCRNRVLADPVIASVSAPPVDVSAMDGYAVRECDLASLPARLNIAGESFAGRGYAGHLQLGECVRIFTGASTPAGADRVVVQEVVRRDERLAIFEATPGPSRHIRKAGSDFAKGDVLLQPGTLIGPRQVVAVAAADEDRVSVWRRPRLVILSTGDELAEPGTARHRPEAIPQSVSFGVAALAEEWGAFPLRTVNLADRLPEMEQAAALALRDADLLVVTGGASVGERDFAKAMFAAQQLELIFSKVAIKPGKPVWLGLASGRIVLGLPGNPTSAMVTARLFLAPLLAGMTGRDPEAALQWRKMELAAPLGATGERETFARGVAEGQFARAASNQDSSAQKVLAESSLLVRLRPGAERVEAGSLVETLDF